MDLIETLFDKNRIRAILKDASAELVALQEQKPVHSFYEAAGPADSSSDDARGGKELKPKTVTEFRLMHSTKIDISATAGACFAQFDEERPLWEMQYMFFFVLYASEALRADLANGSPQRVYNGYLRTYPYRFERHVCGMHNPDVGSAHRVLLGSQDPLEFVVAQVQCIHMAYTGVL